PAVHVSGRDGRRLPPGHWHPDPGTEYGAGHVHDHVAREEAEGAPHRRHRRGRQRGGAARALLHQRRTLRVRLAARGRRPVPAPGQGARPQAARNAAASDPEDRHRAGDGGADLPAGVHLGRGLARGRARRRADPGLSVRRALRGPEAQVISQGVAMAARTGAEYMKGLQAQEREVWLRGERVKDVTTHPGLANGVRAIASLYDLQHELPDEMTYVSPTSGERLGLSFIIPRTREDLARRGAMMLRWARTTCGMMGRSPDFMNVTFAAWAAAASYFARGRPEFGDNIRRYYEYISERDLTLTHSLINLQRSRTASGVFNLEEGTALQVVRETDAGIVVRGARILATLGPLSDEIAVYSPRVARHTETHSPFALNFAIPCATPGLKFLCR